MAVALVLAGGVALAQSDLIVDPWTRVIAGKAAVPAVPAAVVPPRKAARADNGRSEEAARREAPRPVVEPWNPPVADAIPDPWVARTPAAAPPGPPTTAVEEAPHSLHASNWARVLPEIIDPWAPRPLAAYRDPLIVDPWAN